MVTSLQIHGLGPASRFQYEEYRVNYNSGKTLTFFEIPSSTYAQPTYALEDWVQVTFTGSTVGEIYFLGMIKERVHLASNNKEGIRYTAFGVQQIANEIYVHDKVGHPRLFILPPISVLGYEPVYANQFLRQTVNVNTYSLSGVATIANATQIQGTIFSAITQFFGVHHTDLQSLGISSDYDISQIPANATLPGTISLEGPFVTALDKIASYIPGFKVVFDDRAHKWKFVDVLKSPTVVININADNVMDHTVAWSTQGRYTAVKLIAKPLSLYGSPFRKPGVQKWSIYCYPAWDTTLEASWTRDRGSSEVTTVTRQNLDLVTQYYSNPDVIGSQFFNDGDVVPNPFYHVFRTWYVPFTAVAPVKAEAILRFLPFLRTSSTTIDLGTELISVAAKTAIAPLAGVSGAFNTTAGLFLLTQEPVVVETIDPTAPGTSYGPNWMWNEFTATFEMESTAAFDIIEGTAQTLRIPGQGFAGSAYSLFGIRREKVFEVEPQQLTIQNGQYYSMLYKDVLVSGEIPVEGAILPQFCNLQKKVKLSHSSLTTALASFSPYVTEYRYKFGTRGTNYISFTSDPAGFVRLAT